jgi:hypothetical protein
VQIVEWARKTQNATWVALLSLAVCGFGASPGVSALGQTELRVTLDKAAHPGEFDLFRGQRAASIYVANSDEAPVKVAARAFASDLEKVSGHKTALVDDETALHGNALIVVGTIGHSPLLNRLIAEHRIDVTSVNGRWEAATIAVVQEPSRKPHRLLVVAGSDARGTAFALFTISRQIGVSPWVWWADVPVRTHKSAAIGSDSYLQPSPSVQYRGIFINDEDWGLRPWAARTMDKDLHNVGPKTYAHVFELLLRLHGNTLWPAMHPGSLPFHSLEENTKLAAQWGIVMGSSHSEAMLRDNVGEWDSKRNGPWNYQENSAAIYRYWDERASANARYENFYTVGMRGLHDSGLEATGSPEIKARLVEQVIADQEKILATRVNPDLAKVPEVFWLYKESIDLYRIGMKVPDNVTLGWTDDNYGYIRQLPDSREQARPGGSALYYHVSYWGAPHDYLWLCTTPPGLLREELTKAWDHGVRKLWILNVGDIKPAEADIELFFRLASEEPKYGHQTQVQFLREWFAAQFTEGHAEAIASIMEQYYELSFIRRPEFMGFNGYDDDVRHTLFNPLGWGDQNAQRLKAWERLSSEVETVGSALPPEYRNAFFELVRYPVQAAGAQNAKFLWADKSYLDRTNGRATSSKLDVAKMESAYNRVQKLTEQYNTLANGKWAGMMSSHPRERHVFDLPYPFVMTRLAIENTKQWVADFNTSPVGQSVKGFHEVDRTVSFSAAHFTVKQDGVDARWTVNDDFGLSGSIVGIGSPGSAKQADWVTQSARSIDARTPYLEYEFSTTSTDEASISIYLLPTFPLDSEHTLRYGLSIDGRAPIALDAAGAEEKKPNLSDWSSNVLRNAAVQTIPLGRLPNGKHVLRLYYGDPGVVFQHITVTFPNATPAYPFAPEAN